MKKTLISVISSVALLLGGVGLAACDSGTSGHDHVWNDGEITTQATCKAEGVKTFRCTVEGCDETKTEPVSKAPHTWDDGKITTEPSCKAKGVKTFTCTVCDTTRTEDVDKTEHSYDGGKLTVIPTLTTEGEITYTCGVCDNTKTEDVAARDDFAEHFYTDMTSASVWQYGYAEQYDAGTGAFTFTRITQTDEEQPALWTADGVKIGKDSVYSQNNAVIAYPIGEDMQLNIAAAFEGDEEDTRVSAQLSVVGSDGGIKGEIIPLGGEAKDWNYSTEEAIEVAEGDCLYLVFANSGEGAPSGKFSYCLTSSCRHVWDEGVETKQASCTEEGEKTYTCTLCDETRKEAIAMLDHDFDGGSWIESGDGHAKKCANCTAIDSATQTAEHNWESKGVQTPATPTEDGVENIECSVCHKTGTRPIPATGDHVQSTEYGHDENNHWFICSTHNDCGYKFLSTAHVWEEDAENSVAATCKDDGVKAWKCVCGATKTDVVSKDTVAHDFEGAELVSDGNETHHSVCKVCGTSSESVSHVWGEVATVTSPDFYHDGAGKKACACGEKMNVTIPALDSMGVSLNDSNWKFGTGMYDFDAGTYSFTEITTINDAQDAYKDSNGEIKEGWFANNGFDTCIILKYTFEQDVDVNFTITFNGVGGDNGIKSRYSLRIGSDDGKIDGKEYCDGNNFTKENYAAKSYKAGDTVVFIFKHEGDGWDQGNYSITINKTSVARTAE